MVKDTSDGISVPLSLPPWGLLGAAMALTAWGTPSHAVEADNFRLNSTGDLVA
jgi:hypothetical protein